MTGPLPFSPRFKIARKAVRDVLLGNPSHGRVFLQQIRKVDLQPFSRNRIPRSHRFKHVVVRNGNRLLADRSGENNQSCLTLRRKTGCLLDPLFVTALVFRKRASRIVFRFIVDQLVTLRTKKHEILESVNLLRTRPNAPPRSISPERNNVGHLREIALGQSHRMFHQDRKSTRLNSSHVAISYAVFCLKKKNNTNQQLINNSFQYSRITTTKLCSTVH